MKISTLIKSILFGLLIQCSSQVQAAEKTAIEIHHEAKGDPVPISISGISGEALRFLKFDLEVLGMVVDPEHAQFLISGASNGHIEGHLADASKNPIFAKAYNGSSIRSEAHAFAQDIVNVVYPGLAPIFNTQIACRVEQGSVSEILVVDFDGRNPTVITHDNSMAGAPSWMPGNRKLVYNSWKNGPTQIFEHDLATGERKVFARTPGSSYSPNVSPDGHHVAMIKNKNGSPDLWVCDINGGNLKQLTHSRFDKSSPTWSPDGRTICFVSREGRAALFKIDIDGGTPRKITTAAGGNITEPDWSPDGTTIIFTSMTGSFNLYKVSADGGTAEHLVVGEDPCWAPNYRTVVFTRRENNKRVLSLLDVPTKRVKDVAQISGSCSQPAWAR